MRIDLSIWNATEDQRKTGRVKNLSNGRKPVPPFTARGHFTYGRTASTHGIWPLHFDPQSPMKIFVLSKDGMKWGIN